MIPICEPDMGENELSNVVEAVKSGWVSSMGKFVSEFEEKFAGYCGVRYGVATVNGTAALHLALTALDIRNGDEVIVPNLTFIATANAVLYTGAKPVFVDTTPDYWCIDPSKIENAITERTKAIIPVHLFGHPCEMDAINKIAKKYRILVIEDAAEAHGAEYRGKKVGSLSCVSCFSFHGIKIITTGEGGMCLTNDPTLAEKMEVLKDHGMDKKIKYSHNLVGFNYRLTNIQAAIGVAQLKRIDYFIERKRHSANQYTEMLGNITGLELPVEKPWAKHVYWVYALLLSDKFPVSRDQTMRELLKHGIETRNMLLPMSQQPVYNRMKQFKNMKNKYPVSEDIGRRGLYLPSSVKLTDSEIEYICDKIRNISKLKSSRDK